jgi:hypothetical protein
MTFFVVSWRFISAEIMVMHEMILSIRSGVYCSILFSYVSFFMTVLSVCPFFQLSCQLGNCYKAGHERFF